MRIIIFSWHFLGVYSALWGLAAGAFPSSVQIGELEDASCFFFVFFFFLRTDTHTRHTTLHISGFERTEGKVEAGAPGLS